MFFLILSIISFKTFAQPLKTPDELVFELHHAQSCFFKQDTCNALRMSASVLSGSVGPVQATGVFKPARQAFPLRRRA